MLLMLDKIPIFGKISASFIMIYVLIWKRIENVLDRDA